MVFVRGLAAAAVREPPTDRYNPKWQIAYKLHTDDFAPVRPSTTIPPQLGASIAAYIGGLPPAFGGFR